MLSATPKQLIESAFCSFSGIVNAEVQPNNTATANKIHSHRRKFMVSRLFVVCRILEKVYCFLMAGTMAVELRMTDLDDREHLYIWLPLLHKYQINTMPSSLLEKTCQDAINRSCDSHALWLMADDKWEQWTQILSKSVFCRNVHWKELRPILGNYDQSNSGRRPKPIIIMKVVASNLIRRHSTSKFLRWNSWLSR